MWSPVSCFVLPQYQSGLRLLPPRQVEPAEICKMIGFQSNPRGQEEFFYSSNSQPVCASKDLPLDFYISWSLPSPSEQQTFELFGSCRGLSWSLPAISRAGASTACRGQEEDFHQFLLIYFILMIITEPSSLIISRSPSGSTWGQELAQADSCSAPSTASWCPWPTGQDMLD